MPDFPVARREGLPEANGDLSASVPSRAIALANSEVLKAPTQPFHARTHG